MMSPRGRNLDVLRQGLAVGVIFSHAWPLALGPDTPEPLLQLTGVSLGGWAVGAFFFVSGLLITASAERKTPCQFWTARARRILPGLGAALLVTLGLAMISGATANLQEAISWFMRAITLISIEHRLTDAFAQNPYPGVVNGPLWSLAHEVFAYVLCALLVWTGFLNRAMGVLVLLVASAVACLAHDALPGRLSTFAPLFWAFSMGIAAHHWRTKILLGPGTVFCGAILILIVPNPLSVGVVAFGMVCVTLCLPAIRLRSDASYGLYIYGWPVAQTIVVILPGIGAFPLAVLSIVATYPLALISWHWIEQSCLQSRLIRA